MKTPTGKTQLTALLAVVLLSACTGPQPASDPVQDLAALADSGGNVEATLDLGGLGSAAAAPRPQAETVHLYLLASYKGKPLHGLITEVDLPALWAKGGKFQLRGRVQNVRGVPVLVGAAQASAGGQVDIGGVILLSASKTLPPVQAAPGAQRVRAAAINVFLELDGVVFQPRPELEEIVFFKSGTGVVGLGSPAAPTGLPKGQLISNTSMTCDTATQQTGIGPVGNAACKWQGPDFDADKNIIAVLIGL